MRIVLLCCCALVVFASAGARTSLADDGGWTKIYSRPAPAIYSVEMADDGVGLALTGAGILRTDDGGRSWTEPYPIAASTYGDLAFADTRRAWAVGWSGVIRRTDDAGLTWRLQRSGTDVHLGHIAVVSAGEAWVAGAGEGFSDTPRPISPRSVLLHTADGGATWRDDPVPGYGQYFDVAFVGRTGWLVAAACAAGQAFDACSPDHRVLLRTGDGGRSWAVVSETPGVIPERMQWLDAKHGFATSFAGTEAKDRRGILPLYRTDDGGAHWQRTGASADTVRRIRFTSLTDGWISGGTCTPVECRSGLWHSADGGATWARAGDAAVGAEFFAVTSSAVVAGVFRPDAASTGMARLDRKTMAWSPAESAARQPFWSIHFADRERGYALAYQRLLATDDGGTTWAPLETPVHFEALDAPGGGVVWAVAACCDQSAVVYRSTDGARTWRTLATPFRAASTVQAFGDLAAVATTDAGLFTTGDGGGSWHRIESVPVFSERVTFVDPQHAWTLHCDPYTCRDSFRVTDDGGATWQTRPLPKGASLQGFLTPERAWAARVDCVRAGDVCTTAVFATRDGGGSWDEIGRQSGGLRDLTFVSASRGWAMAYDGAGASSIVTTIDGGRTWRPEVAVDRNAGFSGFSRVEGRIWLLTAIGFQGGSDRSTIYRRDFAPEPAPPPAAPRLRPPNTGGGASAGGSRVSTLYALFGLGVMALASGALRLRRSQARRPRAS